MDWKTFFIQIIEAISWPVTIILLFILLRKPIAKLVMTLKKIGGHTP